MLFRNRKYIASESLSKLAWKRFKKNYIAMISLCFILFLALISIFAYHIIPDKSYNANQQNLELSVKKPGFKVENILITKNYLVPNTNLAKQFIKGKEYPYNKKPIYSYSFKEEYLYVEYYTGDSPNNGEIAKYNIADILNAVDTKKEIKKLDNNKLEFTHIDGSVRIIDIEDSKIIIEQNYIKTQTYILGTDKYGRDLLSRIILGSRISLSVGFISVLISLVIGIFLGSVSGFYKGWLDNIIVWFINVIWSIPTLLLVIAITFALGKGFWQIFIAVGLTMWVEVARVVRGQFISAREAEYVEAAKALGYKNSRIINKHILPNVLAPVIVISASNFASAILLEAGLSFLGIGVQPPTPSWGGMIKDHYNYIILDSPYLAIIPGIAIVLLVLSFMLVGNGLRDAMDVKYEK